MSSLKVILPLEDVRSAVNDALMAIFNARDKMINEYVEKEKTKREKWNNYKIIPSFLKKKIDKESIVADVKKLSFAKALSCPVVWAPIKGQETEEICNKYLKMFNYCSEGTITLEKEEWDSIVVWAGEHKPIKFSF